MMTDVYPVFIGCRILCFNYTWQLWSKCCASVIVINVVSTCILVFVALYYLWWWVTEMIKHYHMSASCFIFHTYTWNRFFFISHPLLLAWRHQNTGLRYIILRWTVIFVFAILQTKTLTKMKDVQYCPYFKCNSCIYNILIF